MAIRRRRRGFLTVMLIVLWAQLCLHGAPLQAQIIREDFDITNGEVRASAISGNTLFIGGDFDRVGPPVGGGVPIDAATSLSRSGFPRINAPVRAVASDGAGGWFIGGAFTAVGGISRVALAHIRGDHSVSSWNPLRSGFVSHLARIGNTLYVAGSFDSIGGLARQDLAAVDVSTGLPTDFDAGRVHYRFDPQTFVTGSIEALACTESAVYVAGGIDSIGGEARNGIAELDATTGATTEWNPNANDRVHALAVRGNTVYAGGSFTAIGGQTRNRIAALDTGTGTATSWNPDSDGPVLALAVTEGLVFAGGAFQHIGSQARESIAALDPVTGSATSWNAAASLFAQIGEIVVGENVVYVAGGFSLIGGQPRTDVAALDMTTAAVTPWNPNPARPRRYGAPTITALAFDGSTVYLGGEFGILGGVVRSNLAAVDRTTGRATGWTPASTNQRIEGLIVHGNTMYTRGPTHVRALDVATGSETWGISGPQISAFAVSGSTLYIGGSFWFIQGAGRNGLAAIDSATGQVTPWNPGPPPPQSAWVLALAAHRGIVYAGGLFTSLGGQPRYRLAAIDSASGLATTWSPTLEGGSPRALAIHDGKVYVAGRFGWVNQQHRLGLAAIDIATGQPTDWDPSKSGIEFWSVVPRGDVVYVAGEFQQIADQSRKYFAQVDATTGAITDWHPHAFQEPPPGYVAGIGYTVSADEQSVYVGGSWPRLGAQPHSHLAAIENRVTDVTADRWDRDQVVLLQQNYPNPSTTRTTIAFTLAKPGPVTLRVHDIAGREVATLLSAEHRTAGVHRIPFDSRRLRSGVYFYQLITGEAVAIRRMIVMR